ncbi:transmembrane protein 104-like protein [Dinothrombium tinctorium]|nr:transmembrane protein 104-like protein [Dinothrombium tinctorium]
MSIANAIVKSKSRSASSISLSTTVDCAEDVSDTNSHSENIIPEDEKIPLIDDTDGGKCQKRLKSLTSAFDITERIEFGRMAHIFLPKWAIKFFYISLALYLYGDLAIYAAAISKSLRNMTCNYKQDLCNVTLDSNDQCWTIFPSITRGQAYHLYLTIVLFTLGPLAFFNVQKTKYLQMLTSLFRWIAFLSMITLSVISLAEGRNKGRPSVAKFAGIPSLFGICVYSFMCHHSLPSLITPISNKKNLFLLLISDYGVILLFYCLLSFTGIYTFRHVQDMYTLNFERCSEDSSIIPQNVFLQYFLPLFPVFTLSTNFPIIGITLCNNLKTLFLPNDSTNLIQQRFLATHPTRSFIIERLLFPSLAVIPPVLVAFTTENLEILVGFVGSYAGAAVQYIIPALLMYHSRKTLSNLYTNDDYFFGAEAEYRLRYQSPFRHRYWLYFVLIWSFICILFVTINHIIDWTK